MDELAELMSRDRIRQLAERYALAVDAKNLDVIAGLFADDVDNGQYGQGPEGVKTFFDHVLRLFHCSIHVVANHVIDFDDAEHAHGVVYCNAQHHVLEPEHWFDQALAYWDAYERIDGQWCFRTRTVRAWYRQAFGHPVHGAERVVLDAGTVGTGGNIQMPEAFPTFGTFWNRNARSIPDAAPRP
jgi:hypothetical protein